MRPRTTVVLVRRAAFALCFLWLSPEFAAAQSNPAARPIHSAAGNVDLRPVSEQPVRREGVRKLTKPSRDAAPDAAADSERKPRSTGSIWSVGGPLLLILAAVFGTAFLWRKHGPGVTPGLPRDAVDPLGRRAIDARQSLLLVRIGSRILVLGSSPAGLQTLSEITDPVEVDLLAGICKRPASSVDGGAVDSFRSLFVGRGSEVSARDAAPAAASGRSTPPQDIDDERTPAADQRFARNLSARVRSEGTRAA